MNIYYSKEFLYTRNITDLKKICEENQIRGYFVNNKKELICLILNTQNERLKREKKRKKMYKYIPNMFKNFIHKQCDTKVLIVESKKEEHPDFKDEKEENEEKQCVICFENRKIFAGRCGHLCVCGKCSKDIFESEESLCPICRERWNRIRVIFI